MVVTTDPIYDSYAPIYDAIGQGRFGERMAGWALRWLSAHAVAPASVLDLACGTGAAALAFAAAGCEVIGVDQSPAMLSIARGRARDAGYSITFVEADMRNLNDERGTMNDEVLPANHRSSFIVHRSSFDLVTCFYDSLNYLIDDGDLDDVFAGATAALRPGGSVLFDIITDAEYITWDERDVVVYDGHDCLVYNKLSYEPESRLAEGRIVWFVRETDLWWRGEEAHVQRAWSDDEVCGALARAGLALAGRYDVEGNAARADAARIVYVAIKSPE